MLNILTQWGWNKWAIGNERYKPEKKFKVHYPEVSACVLRGSQMGVEVVEMARLVSKQKWKGYSGEKLHSKISNLNCLSAIWLTEQILLKGYSYFRLLFAITRPRCVNFTHMNQQKLEVALGYDSNLY